jgi:hypothetical protein
MLVVYSRVLCKGCALQVTHGGRAASEMFLARAQTSGGERQQQQQQAAPSPARDSSSLSRRPPFSSLFPSHRRHPSPTPLQGAHTQRRRQFNSSISSRLFPFSISFFLAARRKPIYSSWKWWDQTRWEWIGHPSPQEPRCQSLRNPSTTTTLRLSYITAAPYHLPK